MTNMSKLAEVFGVKALDYISLNGNNFWEQQYIDPAQKKVLQRLERIDRLVKKAETEKEGSAGLYWQLIDDLKEIIGNA